MSKQNAIQVGNLQISNELPFTLFGGMNVLESRELAFEVASSYKEVTDKLGLPYVFKHLSIRPTVHQSPLSVAQDWKKAVKSLPKLRILIMCR